MSSYALIQEQLIKLGVKPQLAHKMAKELVEKSKHNPSLTDEELSVLLAEIADTIERLGGKTPIKDSRSKQYFHAVIQGLIGTGIFELFIQSKAWLSTIINAVPDDEVKEHIRIVSLVGAVHRQGFSKDVSGETAKVSIQIEKNRGQLIKAALMSIGINGSEELVNQVDNLVHLYVSTANRKVRNQIDDGEVKT
ncbi:hypothetical protein HJ059_23155 [Vibrio parahaemolyticus]|uniref:hypothetical protein n=1 Tax=Vibrio parahaemolyticus TaxID=670 RepID=UPI000471810A|nr:hypothetical protein [Vibrio parahaemolyticus]MBE4009501.1 hypothetical protein [Vibrio parahaemolyticus]MBE4350370.1 hypothetical protein [Vibrio parahaemolyticus]MDF4750694.1 hypothetical protein [Vibrio parahaemolyticus]